MGKTRRGHKEYSREQRLIHENQRLKRENARLRKHLAKIDLDRYSQVKDILQEHYSQEEKETTTYEMLQRLKNEWACRECGTGHLEIMLYNKTSGTWYFRKCNNCSHRTKSQQYTPNVKGIIQEENDK